MVEPENILRMKFLDTTVETGHVLMVYMPGPFMSGKLSFLVDELEHDGQTNSYIGYRTNRNTSTLKWLLGAPPRQEIIRFPASFNYMLVSRDHYDAIPYAEAKKDLEEDDTAPDPNTAHHPGYH